jgi:hypothetical protein
LNFQQQNPLKPQYLPHLSSENCEINSIKLDSPESFPTTPRKNSPKFQYNFQFQSYLVFHLENGSRKLPHRTSKQSQTKSATPNQQ